ncbi:P-loop containing nucleoside triphosphate hydrolase protein [Poronia punctata]|nr:P-loop containing nucleoside triphosphate hydrolase protein [Poronia punctata]
MSKIIKQSALLEEKERTVKQLKETLAQAEQAAQAMREETKTALLKEEAKRLLIFNEFQKLRKDIRVMCRIRPSSAKDGPVLGYETSEGTFHSKPAGLEIVTNKRKLGTSELVEDRTRHYNFDRVFEAQETNADVWHEIGQFVQSFVEGRKVTIFCYGQTATGKTYTMSNTDRAVDANGEPVLTNEGIIPRARSLIFEEAAKRREKGWTVTVRGCCYEVYVKDIRLLLPERNVKTKTLDPTGPPWWRVRQPEYRELHSAADFDDMFDGAMESRTFAETTSNSNSSRSHFILYLEFDTKSPTMKNPLKGSLCLVDLAGSEDPHKASAVEEGRDAEKARTRLREGIAINQSLRVLRKSISKIRNPGANGKPTLEGGDEESSTLAKLLGPCLGRDSMVLMFVMINLAADCLPETKATLESGREVSAASIARIPVGAG